MIFCGVFASSKALRMFFKPPTFTCTFIIIIIMFKNLGFDVNMELKIRECYREESGRVWKPGLDEGCGVEDDVAAGAGGEEGRVVGDVTVGNL